MLTWLFIVAKIIIEILNHGTPPTAVAKNINSTIILTCTQVSIEELLNEDCARKHRGLIRIIAEECAARELAKNPIWTYIFWDETQRRNRPTHRIRSSYDER